jgi:glycerol uptake facilitator-like aquaporin
MMEAVGTWIFISVIMAVVYYNKTRGPTTAIAVGGTLFGMATTIGFTSGGCLNPAVGLAQSVLQTAAYGDMTPLKKGAAKGLGYST